MVSKVIDPDAASAKRGLVDSMYRKYSRALSAFLVRQRVRPDEVADIVQETYFRVQQAGRVESIRRPPAFSSTAV